MFKTTPKCRYCAQNSNTFPFQHCNKNIGVKIPLAILKIALSNNLGVNTHWTQKLSRAVEKGLSKLSMCTDYFPLSIIVVNV